MGPAQPVRPTPSKACSDVVSTPAVPVAHDPSGVYEIGDLVRNLIGAPRMFDAEHDADDGELTVD